MSSKVKQANFRLPLEYMALIDDFARREDITKATVITRALDCMQASYDSGHGGMPVTGGGAGGASDAELEELRAKLKKAEERATDAERALQSAEDRLRDAQRQRDEAENRARNAQSDLATAQAQSANVSSNDNRRTEAAEEEVERLRALVAKQAATLEEKIRALASKEVGYDDQARTLANKDAEISSRDAIIADRDKQITELRSQLSEAQARVQLNNASPVSLPPLPSTLRPSRKSLLSVPSRCSTCSTALWLRSSSKSKMHASWASKKAAKLSSTNSKMLSTRRATMAIVMR